MDYFDRVMEAADAVRRQVSEVPAVALVLGSGLDEVVGIVDRSAALPYRELPHWPVPGVPGHEGQLVAGRMSGRRLFVLAGRCHAYEGHDLKAVTFAVRVLGALGVTTLILTNAAGGVNPGFEVGALMVIDDHINLIGGNPLVGPNDDRFGTRFPDLSQVYSAALRHTAEEAGRAAGLVLMHGVYAAVLGPSYETPAEIRYLRAIGADAVGMSTVPEAIVARHMGIDVLGISCITNIAGPHSGPLVHDDVLEAARRTGRRLTRLLDGVLSRL